MELNDFKDLIAFDQNIQNQLQQKNEEKAKMSAQIDAEKKAYEEKSWKTAHEKLDALRQESSERIKQSQADIEKRFEVHSAQLDQKFRENEERWIKELTQRIFE